MNLDLTQLVAVKANKRKPATFDLQLRPKTAKFRVTDSVWATLNLNQNGLTLFMHPTGAILVGLVPEADAQFFKRRGDAEQKGREFTSRNLASLLTKSGFENITDFSITPAGELNGVHYFQIGAFEGVSGLETFSLTGEIITVSDDEDDDVVAETTVTVETIVEEDDAETAEVVAAVEAEAAVAEDPIDEDVSLELTSDEVSEEVVLTENSIKEVETAVEEAPVRNPFLS